MKLSGSSLKSPDTGAIKPLTATFTVGEWVSVVISTEFEAARNELCSMLSVCIFTCGAYLAVSTTAGYASGELTATRNG